MEDAIRADLPRHDGLRLVLQQVRPGSGVLDLDACPSGIDDRSVQDLCQSALRLDLLIVAGDMRHIEGQGEGLRIVLDRVADDGARDAQALADDALTLRA